MTQTLPPRPRRKLLVRVAIVFGAGLVAVGALVVLLLMSAVTRNVAKQNEVAHTVVTRSQLTMLRSAVLLYQSDHGECPSTLNDLVPGYVAAVPVDAWGRQLAYTTKVIGSDPFDLWSAGPDGTFTTEDDVE